MGTAKKQRRATLLFIAGFIVASVAHSLDNSLNYILLVSGTPESSATLAAMSSFLFILNFAIYMALLVFWMTSVHSRLLPSAGRTYIVTAACFMIFFLFQRAVKYRLAVAGSFFEHVCWYVYYIPLCMIPAMFLLTCIAIGLRGKARQTANCTVWISSVAIVIGVLTNDFHKLMFRPVGDMAQGGAWRSYKNGPLWYVFYVYIGLCILTGIILLAKADRRKKNRRRILVPVLLLLLMFGVMELTDKILGTRSFMASPWAFPEAAVFSMLGIFESCIRSRLIPCNENYTELFSNIKLPAVITDPKHRKVFATASPLTVTEEEMTSSLESPVGLSDGLVLYGREIKSGFAFWASDRSVIMRLNEELADIVETLETENDLLNYENSQKEEVARVDARNRVYTRAAEEVYPIQKKIESLLAGAAPGTEDFASRMSEVIALNAYVKRKTNLVLMSAERDTVPARELYLALDESSRYLSLKGIKARVVSETERDFSCEEASSLYDTFEIILEKLKFSSGWLMTTLTDTSVKLMTSSPEETPDFGDTPADVGLVSDDGQLFMTVTAKKGGAA